MTSMILLQRLLFSVAAGFWLVAGALAMFGIVDLGFGSANAARVLGILMVGNGWRGGSRCAAIAWPTMAHWPWLH
jgi:hypothetical protein